MNHGTLIGLALLAIAVILVFVGVPRKDGRHPRFLRFEAAAVLYPPLVLAFFAAGVAQLASSLFG